MRNDILWQIKLAARIHDPAEKALVLLRDPAGHEGGSIVGIGKRLGFETHWVKRRDGSQVEKLKLPQEIARIVERADRWAAGADRAQFPRDENHRFVSWAQVRFFDEGEIINPLSGDRYRVPQIGEDILKEDIKKASEEHFARLIHTDSSDKPDYRLTSLAFWRFGPELGKYLDGIGHLWSLLPADTRTPDHSIWQHLDLVSALAGAMTGSGRPALLTVSIGPVQKFIATGRSTSDLWAGSHFLSVMVWQAMKTIVSEYGPDAILFPQLRAVPIVDLWLIEQGLDMSLFEGTHWNDTATDYNPLFVAALPNKFVALVPERDAADLAHALHNEVQEWVKQEGREMLDLVLKEVGETLGQQHCYKQLEDQLRDFPEVHWSIAPWVSEEDVKNAIKPFYGGRENQQPGFFSTDAWKVLTEAIRPEQNWRFWEPHEGLLYPAIYDLGDRLLGAAKTTRVFSQLAQRGYRDSLNGEYEWLRLLDDEDVSSSPRQRTDTLWARVAKERPSWSKGDKKGRGAEHLSAFGLIKRLWPERFINTIKKNPWYQQLADKPDLSRYVVSTHVMALAPSLERLMLQGPAPNQNAEAVYRELTELVERLSRPALPRGLMRWELRKTDWWKTATRLPALLDWVSEQTEQAEEENEIEEVLSRIETVIGVGVERYYALLLMDGDHMGAWLSGEKSLAFKGAFHQKVIDGLLSYEDPRLKRYLEMNRPVSPSRHMAISTALNGFALDLVRHVIEDECLGKLLYAGGDDVMAMIAVRDVIRAAALLRTAFSGGLPSETDLPIGQTDLKFKRGFVQWGKRLYQVMGGGATASCGVVIAHYRAPLSVVLRELREAERRAKHYRRPGKDGRLTDRDAFHLTILKRSGGSLHLPVEWSEPLELLVKLRDFLADPAVSRRAAYNSLKWLKELPGDAGPEMLRSLLAFQLERQTARRSAWDAHDGPGLAQRLATLACEQENRSDWLERFLGVAEFLARETRSELGPALKMATVDRRGA